MPLYRTHITILERIAALHPTTSAFRIPEIDPETQEILQWHAISYSQFFSDVEHTARYWTQKFHADGIHPRSVIGVWLGGMTYLDLVHLYAVARAGYIPQMFSLRLPNPDIIFELLESSHGKALIYDSSFNATISNGHVPTHAAIDVRTAEVNGVTLPPITEETDGDDTLMIFHTSGSTSGRPKLIPCSYALWDFMLYKAAQCTKPHNPERQDVTAWMGSVCHFGQSFMFSGHLQYAACTVQITSQAFPSSELMDMVTRCGLNRINQFPTFLSTHLRNSRQNPKLLAMLQSLDEIFISGMMLPGEDEVWLHQNGIKLVNCYGNTECGSMMLSVPGWKGISAPLQPVNGASYGFFPVESDEPTNAHQNANARLLELVVLSDSKDCPDRSLRAADGHFHTGDLFQEVSPGRYVCRGRNDDWIKSENSLRCDTKAIEDNVRMTCADLVSDCIVVGNGRPSPALFVEAKGDVDGERLKKDIIRRTRHFHSRRYLHERITSTEFIIVVPKDTLPRTASKGNIRRRAVEEAFKPQLDHVYGVAH